jgi:hypothetical protein
LQREIAANSTFWMANLSSDGLKFMGKEKNSVFQGSFLSPKIRAFCGHFLIIEKMIYLEPDTGSDCHERIFFSGFLRGSVNAHEKYRYKRLF